MRKEDIKETEHSKKGFAKKGHGVAVHYAGGNKTPQGQDIAGAMAEPITCGEIENIRQSARIKNAGKE